MSSKSHISQIELTNVQKSWFRILPLHIPPFSNPKSNDPPTSGAAAKDNTGMAACAATRMESFTTWKSFQSEQGFVARLFYTPKCKVHQISPRNFDVFGHPT